MSVSLSPQEPPAPPAATGPLAAWGITMPRWALWSVAGLLLVGVAILSEQFAPSAPAPAASEKPAKPLSLSPQKTEHEAWLAAAQGELKQLAQQVEKLSAQQAALQQAVQRQEQQRPGLGPALLPPPPGPPGGAGARPPVLKTATDADGLPAEPPPPMREDGERRLAPPGPPPSPPAAGAASGPAPVGPPVSGPLVAPVQAGKPAAAAVGAQKLRVIEADARAIPAKYWMPTGTILPVRLLSGLDAPTGGGAGGGFSAQPHPVLMEVIDLAKLPNEATMDATGCFALGEGLGDISTERAMIRVLGISCVKGDGVAVDLPTKGVLTGEDGKVGMRGRMVIRESAMLARALLTGFVSGVARAFMPFQAGFFVAPSLGQALEPPPASNVALAGAAGGMQRAAELLARHYAQMASRIYPVIEVDAGRWGDLIVTEGRELKEGVK